MSIQIRILIALSALALAPVAAYGQSSQNFTLTLNSSPNPSTFGAAVTFTASFGSPPISGATVSLADTNNGNANLGTALTNSQGLAAFNISTLSVGTHRVQATASAPGISPRLSNIISQVVNQVPTSITVSITPNPSTAGQPVTMRSTMPSASATGTITFFDGSSQIGVGVSQGGSPAVMAFTTSNLGAGTHSIAAIYSGDANFAGSTSPAVLLTVNRAATSLTLTSNPNPSTVGQTVTFTATISSTLAQGAVTLFEGSTILGSGKVGTTQSVTFQVSTLSAGTHVLSAAYEGDNNFLPSNSGGLTQTVNRLTTSISLNVSPLSSVPNQAVTMTATVSPANATGAVTFRDGQNNIGSANLTNGTAVFSTTALTTGSHILTAVYAGDTTFAPSTSSPVTETVGQTPTTTTLSANPASVQFGQTVGLTATVSPASASGNVTFRDGATVLGSASLISGTATLGVSSLAVGTHSLTATFEGGGTFAASTSGSVTVTVGSQTTQITLSVNPSPSTSGQTVVLTATANPSNSTGAIQFLDGGVNLGTAQLNGGSASFSISTLAVGTHVLTASYGGDATHAAATSAAVSHAVNATSTRTTLSVSPTSANFGQTVTLTAVVEPASATGTVTFRDGNNALNTVTLTNGTASFSVSTLATGSHTLSASYNGATGFSTSNSAPVALSIGLQATQTSLIALPNPADLGQQVVLTATVNPSTAIGSVTFMDGSVELGTRTLTNGTASLSISSLGAGIHPLSATYGGTATLGASTSGTLSLTVRGASATINLSVTPSSPAFGDQVTMVATVSPATATGNVTFADGGGSTFLQTVALVNGRGTFTTSNLSVGDHRLIASYSGDGNVAGAQSTVFPLTVVPASTSVTLTASPLSSNLGQPVTLTARVSPASAGGTVTFQEGANALGTATLNNGTATLTISNFTSGTHNLLSFYSGNANFASSISPSITISIGLTATTTALTVSPTSSTFGQAVILTATVAPVAATGTVTFRDGSATLGTANLTAGVATLTTTALTGGAHQLTAAYGGDSRFGVSTSNTVNFTVGTLTSRTTLTASPNPAQTGDSVTFTASVSPATATGTVSFREGNTVLGSAPLNAGAATFSTTALIAGDHSVVASYAGDASHSASASDALTVTVRAAATLRITAPASPLTAGTVGVAYAQTFTAANGSGTLTWSITSSNISALTMSTAGVLSGTPGTAGSFSITVQVRDSATPPATASGTFSLQVGFPPLPSITITVPAGNTRTPQLALAQGYPVAVSGTVSLSFVPDAAGLPANYVNPDVKFLDGRTTAQVSIPANSISPVTLPAVQLGSVAGTVRVTLTSLAAATGETLALPAQAPFATVAIARTAPVIVPGSVRITNITAAGFQVELSASSNPRDLTSASLTFNAAAGTQLNGTQTFNVSLTTAATAWFSATNTEGVANGGAFFLVIPFSFSGDTSVLSTVSSTLANSVGTSAAVSGGR